MTGFIAMERLGQPLAEPWEVADLKAHLRIETAAEDALIATAIVTARLAVEDHAGVALIEQGWRLWRDAWPEGDVLALRPAPVRALTQIRTFAADGTAQVWDPAAYRLDGAGRIVCAAGAWPLPGLRRAGIAIDIVAGYGTAADAIPADLRHAVRLLAAHVVEHRELIESGRPVAAMPTAVQALLAPYRRVAL